MICQNCGKNEANVRYTQIINGSKKEMILCEDCAEELGINNFKMNMPIHFSNFLDDIFDDEQLLPDFIKTKNNKCNSCGELYDDFIKTGLLGCAECYDIFDDRIESVLKNIQGSIKHVGRKPLNISEKLENIGENKTEILRNKEKIRGTTKNKKDNEKNEEQNRNIEKNAKVNNKKEIALLKQDLDKAIKEERYEDAAVIRDKIKDITQKR